MEEKDLVAGTRLKTGNRILILCQDCREKKKKKNVWAAHLAFYWPLPGRDNNRFSVDILWPTYCTTRRLSYYDLILIARLQATPSQDMSLRILFLLFHNLNWEFMKILLNQNNQSCECWTQSSTPCVLSDTLRSFSRLIFSWGIER